MDYVGYIRIEMGRRPRELELGPLEATTLEEKLSQMSEKALDKLFDDLLDLET
jgi:hypothetical protein